MRTFIAVSLFAAAATAATGCAPPDMSVFVEEAFLIDQDCAQGDLNLIAGSLDLGPSAAAGVLPRYAGLFRVRSDLEPIITQTGDDILAGSSRNEFIATTVDLTYQLPGAGIASATEPIYFVVPPGSTDNTILFNMLNTAAAQAIAGSVAAGTQATLLVTFQFNGNVRSSTNGFIPMHTPEVSFPITIYQTTPVIPSCTPPAFPKIVGPCGNSQESYTFGCSQ